MQPGGVQSTAEACPFPDVTYFDQGFYYPLEHREAPLPPCEHSWPGDLAQEASCLYECDVFYGEWSEPATMPFL